MDNKKRGFTLVELIVVIIVIAVLAAAAIPAIVGYQDSARKSRIETEHRNLVSAVQMYIGSHGDGVKYPTNLTELSSYVSGNGKAIATVLATNQGQPAHRIVNNSLESTFIASTGKTKVWTYSFEGRSN